VLIWCGPGYSGVAIYTRNSKCCPIRAEEGVTGVLCPPHSTISFRDLPEDQQIGGYPRVGQLEDVIDEATLDSEGRCVVLEFPAFVLIGVYSPAARDETRTDFRMAFINAMDTRVRNLIAAGKQVVLAGDLNIMRDALDTAAFVDMLRKENMTYEDFMAMPSRRFFNQLLFGGRVLGGERDFGREEPVMWDLCREFHPERQGMFTCWETKKNARPGNFGSRIDYITCSSGLRGWFVAADIQEGLLGSDHCPVYANLGDMAKVGGADVHIEDVINPSGMFQGGQRLREWSSKDLLPLSAKLIPEFDRRQSIKDMFFKKTTVSVAKPKAVASSVADEGVPGVGASGPSVASGGSGHSPTSQDRVDATATRLPAGPTKRGAASPRSPAQPQKKARSGLSREPTKAGPGFSQRSLTGFFKPKPTVTSAPPTPLDDKAGRDPGTPDFCDKDAADDTNAFASATSGSDDRVFDPVENKESWSKLLGKRVAPRCEHDEPCISYVTKKAGLNCGGYFPS